MKKVKLNLGCGLDVRDGWENYDNQPTDKRVRYLDLSNFPLDFPDCYADEILLSSVFEHLSCNRFELMKELSRILKPDGKLIISMPVNHPCVEHENNFFTLGYFNCLTTEFYGSLYRNVNVSVTKDSLRGIVDKIKKFWFWCYGHKITYELKK